MNLCEFITHLTSSKFSGRILENEPLSSRSTMNVGGPAKVFIEPQTEESLILAVRTASENNLDFFILGGGSNTIFPDEGLDMVITTRAVKEEIIFNSQFSTLNLPAGTSWAQVITYCKKHNLGGFEPFTGLSGTVGGALYMNATCFGLSTCDNLISAKELIINNEELIIEKYIKKDSDWGYKKSPFQTDQNSSAEPVDKIILSATFKVTQGFDQAKSDEVKAKRIAMGHFKAPSAGSAFKNKPDEGIIAGKLIDECGLKGFAIGGAQIAPWHGNFIINPDKKASAQDIKKLVKHVQQIVAEKTGVRLEPEILFV